MRNKKGQFVSPIIATLGTVKLSRRFHVAQQKRPEFIRAFCCSGLIGQLENGQVFVGCANCNGAGRAYTFTTWRDLVHALRDNK